MSQAVKIVSVACLIPVILMLGLFYILSSGFRMFIEGLIAALGAIGYMLTTEILIRTDSIFHYIHP